MSTSDQLQQAYQLIREGRRQEAAAMLVPLVRSEPNNADAWWLLANAITNTDQQRRALEKVLSIRPDDERAQRKLSQITGAPPPPPPDSVAPTISLPTAELRQSADAFRSTPPVIEDPFASPPPTEDPFAQPARYAGSGRAKAPPPVYGAGSYGTGPASYAVESAPPPRRRSGCGCNCCLLTLVGMLLVSLLVCGGSAFLLNQAIGGLQNINNVVSGSATLDPNSMIGQALGQEGRQARVEMMATVGGLTGLVNAMDMNLPGAQATLNAALSTAMGASIVIGSPLPPDVTMRGAMEYGQQVTGTISNVSGEGWTFSGSAGQVVVIEMSAADSSLDSMVRLYGPDRLMLALDDDSGGGYSARLTFTLQLDGTYTIQAASFPGSTGAYTLRLSRG